jgi:hypothetical protein
VTISGLIPNATGSSGSVFFGMWKGLEVAVKTVVFAAGTSEKTPQPVRCCGMRTRSCAAPGANCDCVPVMQLVEAAVAASVGSGGHRNIVRLPVSALYLGSCYTLSMLLTGVAVQL